MRKRVKQIVALFTVLLLILPFSTGIGSEKERKIIIFKSGVSAERRAEVLGMHGAEKINDLRLINGQTIMLPPGRAGALADKPEVLLIEDDVPVTAQGKPGKVVPQPTQSKPWGIDCIEADECWTQYTGDSVNVAILDTGIDTVHPDLIPNIQDGVSFVSYTSGYQDDNGHGTHVAGIVAAADNSFGVIGVGPKIHLYAVKVLDRKGNGYTSNIIKGLEWCLSNNIQVVNMSLGSSAYSQALADAVKKLNTAGIVQVAAAGNSGGSVIYPAALDEVIAVGAIDNNNSLAWFSCYGPEIDLVAPGVGIYSTYKGKTYSTMSGTSMAAPHVTGAAALILNADSSKTPAEVQSLLESNTTELGEPGRDDYYGWGLINIYKALF